MRTVFIRIFCAGRVAMPLTGDDQGRFGRHRGDCDPRSPWKSVPAAVFTEGFGKAAGFEQVPELSMRQARILYLERMVGRAPPGIACTAGRTSNGSGDFVISSSTSERVRYDDSEPVRGRPRQSNGQTSALFLATVEAVEEAISNALVAAESMAGAENRTLEALSTGIVRSLAARRDEFWTANRR